MNRRSRRATLIFLGLAVVFVMVRLFVVHTVRIQGSSMDATLRDGEIALVTCFDYRFGGEPARGDIVECAFPNRSGTYVKRVIGLPGERIEIRDGKTYIDGAYYAEEYVSSYAEDYAVVLGEDEYLVLGDNRAESYDSRSADMGLLKKENFLGRVRMVLSPMREIDS